MAVQKTTGVPALPRSTLSSPTVRSTSEGQFTTEEVAKRAYEIFLNRGGDHGHDQEDWFQAEQELRLGRQ